MNAARKLFAFLFSAAIPIPLFFYFPGFTLYLESSFVRREGGAALLPVCFLPLFILLLLNSRQIFRYFLRLTPLRGLLSLVAVSLISIINGASPLFSLQLITGLVLVYIWPILIGYFSLPCVWAALVSAVSFGFLHLYDAGYIFGDLSATSLSFWEYPFIYGYFIYHSYVSFPEVLGVISASGLALSSLFFSQFRRLSAAASALLSVFVFSYGLSYGRASTFFAAIISVLLSVAVLLWPLIVSFRLTSSRFKYLFGVSASALILSSSLPFVATFYNFAYTRFLLRSFEQGGTSRLDVWGRFIDSFSQSDLLSILFGSGLSGAHNLFLDLVARVGLVGLFFFVLSLYLGLRIISMSLRDSGIAILPPSVPLILFCSVFVTGNIFNVSLAQPWSIASYLFFWSAFSVCSVSSRVASRGFATSSIAQLESAIPSGGGSNCL